MHRLIGNSIVSSCLINGTKKKGRTISTRKLKQRKKTNNNEKAKKKFRCQQSLSWSPILPAFL